MITLTINDTTIEVEAGTTVAAAMLNSGIKRFRRSVGGRQRGPLCGMGICFECRVTIDGSAHQRSCTRPAEDGMVIKTDE